MHPYHDRTMQSSPPFPQAQTMAHFHAQTLTMSGMALRRSNVRRRVSHTVRGSRAKRSGAAGRSSESRRVQREGWAAGPPPGSRRRWRRARPGQVRPWRAHAVRRCAPSQGPTAGKRHDAHHLIRLYSVAFSETATWLSSDGAALFTSAIRICGSPLEKSARADTT